MQAHIRLYLALLYFGYIHKNTKHIHQHSSTYYVNVLFVKKKKEFNKLCELSCMLINGLFSSKINEKREMLQPEPFFVPKKFIFLFFFSSPTLVLSFLLFPLIS